MKGFLITFEGIDGIGKTTQLQLTADKLKKSGYDVILTREPGGTILGEDVRNIVLNDQKKLALRTEILLFMAARSQHAEELIRPALERGQIVICDRYCDSTYVYQGLARALSQRELDELQRLNIYAMGGVTPDITFLLDADPVLLVQRRQQRGISDRYENAGLEFQKKLRQGFLDLAQCNLMRIKVISGEQDREQVTNDIMVQLREFMQKRFQTVIDNVERHTR